MTKRAPGTEPPLDPTPPPVTVDREASERWPNATAALADAWADRRVGKVVSDALGARYQ